ncbi:MAG: 30S ribosomal protein S9 [Flavobacteriales bacterium]|nr:30S ribosomal protein S9 [Flavobacteriales bacterium]MCB9446819.1 30S ribosomal protein S9 [Flavobacteriales bacterium]
MDTINTIGRRKTSVARLYLSEGEGVFYINKRDGNEYFTVPELVQKINQPFELTESKGKYDVVVNVKGGGIKGQAEAIRLAISKALCEVNPEFRAKLKPEGLLTRDSRMVERKKFGRRKARKRFQFSKR